MSSNLDLLAERISFTPVQTWTYCQNILNSNLHLLPSIFTALNWTSCQNVFYLHQFKLRPAARTYFIFTGLNWISCQNVFDLHQFKLGPPARTYFIFISLNLGLPARTICQNVFHVNLNLLPEHILLCEFKLVHPGRTYYLHQYLDTDKTMQQRSLNPTVSL